MLPPSTLSDVQPDPPAIYLEERGDNRSQPQWHGVPSRRLRGKQTVPAIRSLFYSEGEAASAVIGLGSADAAVDVDVQPQTAMSIGDADLRSFHGPMVFHFEVPQHLQSFFDFENVTGSDDESWSLHTGRQHIG